MGEETQKLQKTNPMRLWLERHLGKVLLTSVPVVLTMLAGWIYTIGNEIAVMKEKIKEDEAQWSALLSTNEKVRDLEVESRVNQKLLYLISEREIDPELLHLERLLKEEKSPVPDPEVKETRIPRRERLEDYKAQQMQQMSR